MAEMFRTFFDTKLPVLLIMAAIPNKFRSFTYSFFAVFCGISPSLLFYFKRSF